MTWPIQLGDIAVALQTIIWIKQNCFSPNSQADKKYKELKDRIEAFERTLVKLKEVVESVIPSPHIRGPLPAPSETKPSLDIGDFQSTLEECKSFLRKYAHVEGRVTSPFENGLFAKSADHEVQALKDKIHEHYQSATIVILTMQVEYMSQFVQMEHANKPSLKDPSTTQAPEKLPPIPQEWQHRFRDSLLLDDGIKLDSTKDIPLPETLESIHDHFTKSECSPTSPQLSDVENPSFASQFLHLLKAQYLHELAQQSTALQSEPDYSRNRQYVATVEQKVAQRYKAFEIQPSEKDLLEQWSRDQSIWPVHSFSPELKRKSGTSMNLLERKVLQIELPNRGMYAKDELQITRVSDETLLLDRKRTCNSTASTETIRSTFRLYEDKLIPWYVVNAKAGLSIKSPSAPGIEFHLKSRVDKLRLQAAFTGYDVCNPECAFSRVQLDVAISKGVWNRKLDGGVGEVQLWNWPTQKTSAIEIDSPTSPVGSHASSKISSPTLTATTITRGLNSSIFTCQGDETGTSMVIDAKLPPPPLLIAFTLSNRMYQIWRADLTATSITEERKGNSYTVIRANDKLHIRKLSVRKDELESWDLCTISLPSHPQFNNRNVVELVKGAYLVLRFSNESQRDSFNQTLRKLLDLRSRQEELLRQSRITAKAMGTKINHTVTR